MERLKRFGTTAIAGFVAISGAGVALAAAASAEVPTCVYSAYRNPAGPYQDVYVKNHCPGMVRVKVLWSPATDSRCFSIKPNQQIRDHHLDQWLFDKWDGLKSC